MLIGEVAERSGISSRMLRHYDRTGVVSPSGRTAGGYRYYTDEELAGCSMPRGCAPWG